MSKAGKRKFSSLMDARVLEQLKKEARQNGQSLHFLLQKAVEHYLLVVLPSSQTVRPEMIGYARRTMDEHDDLLRRLAKAE